MNTLLLLLSLVPQDVDDLIRRLDTDAVESREEAAAALARLGPSVLPRLEKEIRSSGNPEIVGQLRSVVREILAPPELRELLSKVTRGPWSWYGRCERPPLRDDVLVAVGRELLERPERRKRLEKLAADPAADWKGLQEAVDALREDRAAACLAVGLLHPSYQIQLRCADGLAALGARDFAPLLLDVAKALSVGVDGSKSATVHGFRQHGVAVALDRLLRTSAAWPGGGQNPGEMQRGLEIWKAAIERRD